MRTSCRLALLILTLSASGIGAQSVFHAYDGEILKFASWKQEARAKSADHSKREMLTLNSYSLSGHSQNEMALAPVSIESIIFQEIPGHKSYRYAIIGDQRFIVDSASHSVIYEPNETH